MGAAEAKIQRDILDFLSGKGYLAWRNHVQGIRLNGKMLKNPNKGQPDVWAVKDGRLLGVEVKTREGVLSPDQIEWINRASRYGVPIITAHSLEELIETLHELDSIFPITEGADPAN
jgi:hypothetical protein